MNNGCIDAVPAMHRAVKIAKEVLEAKGHMVYLRTEALLKDLCMAFCILFPYGNKKLYFYTYIYT